MGHGMGEPKSPQSLPRAHPPSPALNEKTKVGHGDYCRLTEPKKAHTKRQRSPKPSQEPFGVVPSALPP